MKVFWQRMGKRSISSPVKGLKFLLHLALFVAGVSELCISNVSFAKDQLGGNLPQPQQENPALAQGIETYFEALKESHTANTPDVSKIVNFIEANFHEDAQFIDRLKVNDRKEKQQESEERKTRHEIVASVRQSYAQMYDMKLDYIINNISYEDGGLVAVVDYRTTLHASSNSDHKGKPFRVGMTITSACKDRFVQEREKILNIGRICDVEATYEKPVPIP